jgi:hypothetical protein
LQAEASFLDRALAPPTYAVLARVSPGYPPLQGRLPTCYSPVRRSPVAEATFAHDLHVLSTPPAFILSQDQTLQLDPSPPGPAKGPRRFVSFGISDRPPRPLARLKQTSELVVDSSSIQFSKNRRFKARISTLWRPARLVKARKRPPQSLKVTPTGPFPRQPFQAVSRRVAARRGPRSRTPEATGRPGQNCCLKEPARLSAGRREPRPVSIRCPRTSPRYQHPRRFFEPGSQGPANLQRRARLVNSRSRPGTCCRSTCGVLRRRLVARGGRRWRAPDPAIDSGRWSVWCGHPDVNPVAAALARLRP